MKLFEERRLGKFPVFLKDTEGFIGTCGMEPYQLGDCTEIELGYRLCLDHWGKGYAREAAAVVLRYGFQELKLERILGLVLPENRASLRILESLGFQYREDFLHAGLRHRLYEIRPDDLAR